MVGRNAFRACVPEQNQVMNGGNSIFLLRVSRISTRLGANSLELWEAAVAICRVLIAEHRIAGILKVPCVKQLTLCKELRFLFE